MYTNVWLPGVLNGVIAAGEVRRTSRTAPAMNVQEYETEYVVELAAPGMRKEDFELNINGEGDLKIRMERKVQEQPQHARYLRREFAYSNFEKTLTLPDDVDRDKIGATVADGVLTVHLPKVNPAAAQVARQIEIA